MFNVVLYQPEIPPNTGNIIRLCANCGSGLHLIEPLGFELSDKQCRRAGLDYHEWVNIGRYSDFDNYLDVAKPPRLWAASTKGHNNYAQVRFQPGDAVIFGPETRGLPPEILGQLDPEQILRIPMLPGSRSMNLANSVSVILYEAWRQQNFAVPPGPDSGTS